MNRALREHAGRRAGLVALGVGEGVERAVAGGPPTAFRIWKAGDNPTDHGPTVFSDRSAQMLIAEQAMRGNLYSIDVDHKSLSPDAPIDLRKAVGYHRIEVRGGELWATNVEWAETVRAGLTKEPPEWRYFSPAYDVDPETDEVVSYLNTALTNNPATWNVTALASRAGVEKESANARERREDAMNYENVMAELAKLARGGGPDAAKAHKALKSMMPDHPAPDGDEGKDKPAPPPKEKDAAAAAKDDEDEDAKKAAASPPSTTASEDEEAAKKAVAATRAQDADLLTRVGELERYQEREERARIMATRPDLTKGQVEYLSKKPVSELPEILALIPVPAKPSRMASLTSADRATPTRGNGQGGHDDGLDAETARRIDIQCGITPQANAIVDEGSSERAAIEANRVASGGFARTYNTMTPEAAREFLANKSKARGQGMTK